MLVRLGRLSGDELLGMIQKQRETLKRMGSLLLESGKVSQQDLQDALFNQAMSIIYRTFRWVEGDYRFDSMLPLDLDRDNFPPIPVDTVLMEAARIMDEWPEVQRRLPDNNVPLRKTDKAMSLRLDIDQELSSVLDGPGRQMPSNRSGLSHEQETVLTYFLEPQSIQSVLQITRYDELDTCKVVAELLEMGLLEIAKNEADRPAPLWNMPVESFPRPPKPAVPSPLLWPLVGLLILLPILIYVPRTRASMNQGLASLQRADVQVKMDSATSERRAWAFRMASPKDGGRNLLQQLGGSAESDLPQVPDLTKEPDPLPSAAVAPLRVNP